MPLHLPSISRRQFLTSSVAAGLTVWTWRVLPGEERASAADHWILLADSHVAADREAVHRGVKMAENLTRVVTAVAALDPRPAGVVLNGDAAFKKGEAGDYRLLAELLKPLGQADVPIHFTLGNHDDRENMQTGLLRGTGKSPLVSRQVAVLETPRANWFLLDSLEKVNATPGELGTEQIDWLAKALDKRKDKPALVVVHHDPQWPAAVNRTGLRDTEKLFAVLVPCKQVKALFYGHTHQWQQKEHEGIHLVNLPPVGYLFNKEAPNGWVELRLREGGAVLTLHALDDKHRQNGEKVELAWR
jgi:3',5'-cyclic AMP phosphodiesterase CpdA